jgi:hypothetical protein
MVSRRERGQRLARLLRDLPHRERGLARQGRPDLVPPQRRGTSAVRVDDHLARAAAGLAHLALVGQADLDPLLERAGQVATQKVRLVLGA